MLDFRQGLGAQTMTITEAAAYLNKHPGTIRRWVKDQQLFAFKVGNVWHIDKQSLAAFISEQKAIPVFDVDLQRQAKEARAKRIAKQQGPQAFEAVQQELFSPEVLE